MTKGTRLWGSRCDCLGIPEIGYHIPVTFVWAGVWLGWWVLFLPAAGDR
ncbi:hypothetical protein HMPREF0293_0695 [Corynebacterium glucuronolyticum ATCC 51866]|uniref:Uncharacterized protein n=1 Tax=Corynebacterium glucuronolyticum ATCC 51866 TaxID=548478 RepID=A0ABM9XRT2_9CORY|nr:hypothetical protein HMPREF0293_0695 [Corynebacterium glucuronolyticum ATCC 51866]